MPPAAQPDWPELTSGRESGQSAHWSLTGFSLVSRTNQLLIGPIRTKFLLLGHLYSHSFSLALLIFQAWVELTCSFSFSHEEFSQLDVKWYHLEVFSSPLLHFSDLSFQEEEPFLIWVPSMGAPPQVRLSLSIILILSSDYI